MTQEFTIKGMNCPHCQASVQRAIAAVPGVESVDVDLKGGKATVNGTADASAIAQAVTLAGFTCE